MLHKIRHAGVTKLVLTGGDPPAHPDFMKILEFCAKNFLIVDIATNGYRINDEMARTIAGMDRIGGSLLPAIVPEIPVGSKE